MTELQETVARSADAAELHATAPTLLLELQTLLGAMAAIATAGTERGRRPFRPTADWAQHLGELAYGVYLLADQTGVDLEQRVRATAEQTTARGEQAKAADQQGWPFEAR